jgi:hypothetical protein
MLITAISDAHGSIRFIDKISDSLRISDLVVISGDLSRAGDINSAIRLLEAVEKYNSSILAVHGNWDGGDVLSLLIDKGYSIHGSGRIIGNTGFFGCGGSNKTPLKTASEYTEEEIYSYLETGHASVKSAGVKVMVSHTPPRGTVDKTFIGIRAGSSSVLNFITENKIDICFCGHIHEAAGVMTHCETVVINSGSLKSGRYSTSDTDKKTGSVFKLNRFLFF